MTLSSLPFVVLCVSSWVLWRLLRPYITKHPLDNLPGPVPYSYLTGDLVPLFHRHAGWEVLKRLEEYGPIVRIRGLLGARVLFVSDPAVLQHIIAKDGIQYDEPAWSFARNDIVFGPGLLSVHGHQHRRQRRMLNPIFSTENMRNMTPMFYRLTHKLREAIATLVSDGPQDIDVVHWMGRAALEFVAQGGMGHSFDPLMPDVEVNNAVGEALKSIIPLMYELNMWGMLSIYWQKLGPPQLRRKLADLLVFLVPDKNLQRLRDVVNTMDAASRTIYHNRKVAMAEGDGTPQGIAKGKDILSILLKSFACPSDEKGLSESELLAQMSTILFAGTDTTSNALGHTLQMLAEHPNVQAKLREELATAQDFPGQDIPYDRLIELPLLDAICRETLRLHSPVNIVPRETLVDVVIPLQKPVHGVNGDMITELSIPQGTLILPSFLSCNTSKDIWGEDALQWKPERWLSSLPRAVTEAKIPGVYSNLMTFGGGPRSCIGFRFSQLEMKLVLSVLLKTFRFCLTDRSVIWNLSGISYPTMDMDSIEASLYLKVEAICPDDSEPTGM